MSFFATNQTTNFETIYSTKQNPVHPTHDQAFEATILAADCKAVAESVTSTESTTNKAANLSTFAEAEWTADDDAFPNPIAAAVQTAVQTANEIAFFCPIHATLEATITTASDCSFNAAFIAATTRSNRQAVASTNNTANHNSVYESIHTAFLGPFSAAILPTIKYAK
jgi:hypothetical protein